MEQFLTELYAAYAPYILNPAFGAVLIVSLAATHAAKEWASRYRKHWKSDDRRWNNFLVAAVSGAVAAVYFYRAAMPWDDLIGFAVVMGGCSLAGGWLLDFATTLLLKRTGLESSPLAKLVKPHRRLTVVTSDTGEVKVRDEETDETLLDWKQIQMALKEAESKSDKNGGGK